MKISLQWLKARLHFDLTPEDTASYLTNCGLEVEGMEVFQSVPGNLEGLVVGEVVEKSKHPNADKLSLTKVDVGRGDPLHIVCGAPNVAAGQKVIVAPIGTTIRPLEGEPVVIKKSKIRGEVSEGMLCAEDEVGLGHDHSGIVVLPAHLANGSPVKDHFEVEEDVVFEIGLTPNRGDAASHYGVARDLYAVLRHHKIPADLHSPKAENTLPAVHKGQKAFTVTVENTDACPRYSGIAIEGITVAPSPAWLQNRLKAIGLQPISNVVDITNFVLHDLGQPLHAFDADKIRGNKVTVKCLPDQTPFVTLDEKERKLRDTDLMICDAEGGMCIAGVFGGKGSGIGETTQNIFLESACFSPSYIRRTASYHDLKTDASFRFERGTDPNLTVIALKKAAALICEYAGGKVTSEVIDIYPHPVAKKEVTIRWNRITRLLGKHIAPEEIRDILTALDFDFLTFGEAEAIVAVPTYKGEVTREVDVAEEILRIYGCNAIEISSFGRIPYVQREKPSNDQVRNKISDYLVSNGFNEIMCNSLTSDKHLALVGAGKDNQPAVLVNPLSSDLGILRTSLLFGGLETLAYNLNRRNQQLTLFEFGRTYVRVPGGESEKGYKEENFLALYATGDRPMELWSREGEKAGFYYLKGGIEHILLRLGLGPASFSSVKHELCSESVAVMKEKRTLAMVGRVSVPVQRHFDIHQEASVALIYWDEVMALLKNRPVIMYKELSKFPWVRRDLALIIDKQTTYDTLEKLAWKHGGPLLRAVSLFDVFEGKQIGQDKKSYALSLIFRNDTKTLTDKEVDDVMQSIAHAMVHDAQAEIRET